MVSVVFEPFEMQTAGSFKRSEVLSLRYLINKKNIREMLVVHFIPKSIVSEIVTVQKILTTLFC